MTTVPKMKLPDILVQFRKKDRAASQTPVAGQASGKSYEPIQPGDGKKPYKPLTPKGGASRFSPFLVGIVVISILFGINDFIRESEPFKIASALVKESPQINDDLGEVMEISPWFPSSLKTSGSTVRVRLTLRVEGKKGSGKAYVTMVYLQGHWQITNAFYEDRQGRVSLLIKGRTNQ